MGRIIKFRAKAMSEEAWVYGDLIHYTRPRCEKDTLLAKGKTIQANLLMNTAIL